MKCKNCKYFIKGTTNGCCELTHRVQSPNIEHKCNCYNKDLSPYNICYNCKYYIGGGDWGLFCSHKDKYHHLGRFNDKPCEVYEKNTAIKKIREEEDGNNT